MKIFGQLGFVRSVGGILCVTGLAKLTSVFGHSHALALREPLLQIFFRELFLVAGIGELVMAAYCLCAKHLNRATAIIAWLSTGFFIYRLSLSWVEWRLPCPCLGNFVELLHLSPRLADLEMKVLAAYMLAGSGFHLLRNLCRNAGAKPGSYNRPLTSNTALN